MKKSELFKNTTDNRTYNMLQGRYEVYCMICYRRSGSKWGGCNGQFGPQPLRNWKEHRKTQFKNEK